MATGAVRVADCVVPEVFDDYMQLLTEQKSALLNAGILVKDESLDAKLAGGGATFQSPSWKDLDNDDESIASDDPAARVPYDGTGTAPNVIRKISSVQETAVRCARAQRWSSMALSSLLSGADPSNAIAGRVAAYWNRRRQTALIATAQGIFADNAAAPTGSDQHSQNDLTLDLSSRNGGTYLVGTTTFNAEDFIDACGLMGDSQDGLGIIMVHTVVYNRMLKNNLIDFRPDAVNPDGEKVPFYLGRRVVQDDGMPNPSGVGAAQTASGIYHSWVMGPGVFRLGVGKADVPSAVERKEDGGNGFGQEILWSRQVWCIHPVGHAFIGSNPGVGGPSNASTPGNLAAASSWSRVFTERKQIKMVRIITRETA